MIRLQFRVFLSASIRDERLVGLEKSLPRLIEERLPRLNSSDNRHRLHGTTDSGHSINLCTRHLYRHSYHRHSVVNHRCSTGPDRHHLHRRWRSTAVPSCSFHGVPPVNRWLINSSSKIFLVAPDQIFIQFFSTRSDLEYEV